jgi:probable phosphoglycerate mutase
LNEKGVNYAGRVADYFKNRNIPVANIVTSDLNRAVQTAEIISRELKLPLLIEDLVRERASGLAEGKTEREIDWQNYEAVPVAERKHPGGESFLEVKERARLFMEKVRNNLHEDFLVVSHSVFILMLLSLIKSSSIEDELKTRTADKIFVIDVEKMSVETLDIIHSQ